MANTIFTGAGVALVTPMNPDGSVNYDVFGKNIDWQISQGINALVACGTTGEASTLTDGEHIEVIRYCADRAKKRVPVIAGTGSNDTLYSIELSKEAEKAGADALLQVTPYYNKTSQKGLIAHFTKIADSVNIPMILYNVPSRTAMSFTVDTYRALSEHKNIAATKEACGNIGFIAEVIAACGDKLAVYSGNDNETVPVMALGGIGVISTCANIIPNITRDITALCLSGDFKQAAALQLKYLGLMNSLFTDVNPIPVKAAMNLIGMNVGNCRLPLCEPDEACLKKLRISMEQAGLI